MKALIFLNLFLVFALRIYAESLTIQSPLPPNGLFDGSCDLRFSLLLDVPADHAELNFSAGGRALFLNGTTCLTLTPAPDRKTFSGRLKAGASYYSPAIYNGWEYPKGYLAFTPMVMRGDKVSKLSPANLPYRCRMPSRLQVTGKVTRGAGRFGDSLATDGLEDMVAFQRTRFSPEAGTLELWLALPPIYPETAGVVAFIQSADGSPWSYHQISIPARTRKLCYSAYSHERGITRQITSQTISKEDYVYVMATWSLKQNAMRLWIDGTLAGTETYDSPCGGRKAELTLGARVHNGREGSTLVGAVPCMIDDFRVSRKVREPSVPEREATMDEDTLLLLNFADETFLTAQGGDEIFGWR